MLLGRPHLFQCDFCQAIIARFGHGLPHGWRWIAGNVITKQPLVHICGSCVSEGKHGTDDKILNTPPKTEAHEEIFINKEKIAKWLQINPKDLENYIMIHKCRPIRPADLYKG
jgi:hypothetical protein